MYMAYSNNPNLPRVRMEAVRLVRSGWSVRMVGRHLGYTHSAVVKWLQRAPQSRKHTIPTLSSKPKHPHTLSFDIISKILRMRAERNQCAFIIHYRLNQEGINVSLSSVKRTLQRCGISKYSRWKKWHAYPPRPMPETPGKLIEIDTILDGIPEERLCVYTLLDVCSRWAHALPSLRINTHKSLRFVEKARIVSPFEFSTIQSDHGSEFSKWFTKMLEARGLSHRHSRVRTPNDNAHLERFNRTIQEECLQRIPRRLSVWQKEIPQYLRYYNYERPHMGLAMKTPIDIIKDIKVVPSS